MWDKTYESWTWSTLVSKFSFNLLAWRVFETSEKPLVLCRSLKAQSDSIWSKKSDGYLNHKVSKQRRRKEAKGVEGGIYLSWTIAHFLDTMEGTRSRSNRRSANDFKHWCSMKTVRDRRDKPLVKVDDCGRTDVNTVDVYQHPERCAQYFKTASG